MKKILMRGHASPFENFDFEELLLNNSLGTNAGNMLFLASISRAMMIDEKTQIDYVHFNEPMDYDIDYINKKYECFIMPLANAFRSSFRKELDRMTEFIKKLKIPCVVIGVGVQGIIKKDVKLMESVKDFMNAVLEKSSIVGVRGRMTGEFLTGLGYKEERDFTVIGCPSLFYYGDKLPENNPKELTLESRISVSRKHDTPNKLHDFIESQMALFPDHWFVPQVVPDYKLLYAGVPLDVGDHISKESDKNYPKTWDAPIFKEDRALAFLNIKTWMDFLSTCDFVTGSRIHGNIAGILAGTPAFVFAPDVRITEIAQYHNIPHMLVKDITDETSFLKVYNETDFSSIYRGHEDRFNHYVDFLKQNQLETIYTIDPELVPEVLPFDAKMDSVEFPDPLHSLACLPEEERMDRIVDYYSITEKLYRSYRKQYRVGVKKFMKETSYEASKERVKNHILRRPDGIKRVRPDKKKKKKK